MKKGLILAENELQQRSMLPIAPVISRFPFTGVRSLVNLYEVFRFEPIHMLLLDISKLLNECSVLYLLDPSGVFSAMSYRSSKPKPFGEIRKTVHKLLNELLKISEENSM